MVNFLDLKRVNQSFQPELSESINRVVESGWYLQGEENRLFEEEYSKYIGVSHTIGCANGLDALKLIFMAYKELGILKDGDEVIVSASTFIATLLAITETGLVAVPVDADSNTMQINADKIEESITPKTKAVVIVHLYGKCAYSSKIENICTNNNLLLIEDNAQAHGCLYQNRRTGSIGDAAAQSFYPGKNLGALGDGGAVTTNNARLAAMIRRMGNYGGEKKYIYPSRGLNSRLDDIQAAALRVKLHRLDSDNEIRRKIATRYVNEINNSLIKIPAGLGTDKDNVVYAFPILCEYRAELQEHLLKKGVQTIIHYPIPPHKQLCYQDKGLLRCPADGLPVTDMIHDQELSLPVSPIMTDNEIREVIDAVNSFHI